MYKRQDETSWWTPAEAKEKGFVDEVEDDALPDLFQAGAGQHHLLDLVAVSYTHLSVTT